MPGSSETVYADMPNNDTAHRAWRLIDTGFSTAAENMAIDEALLQQFDPVRSQPILRLYGWQPAALSLGRFQKPADELDLERVAADRLPLVRRITGGGALYHADELTYAVVCSPAHIPSTSSIKDSFRVLTSFLLGLYRSLGLTADYAVDAVSADVRLGERTPFCFAGKESYDILVNGRKIGGNAQRRLKETIFQHGSIPLRDHLADGMAYLRAKPQGLADTVTCLAAEGIYADREQLTQLLAAQFAEQLHARLQPGDLTAAERATAERLWRLKYAAPDWTLDGEQR